MYHMDKVARLLGVELGDKFKVKDKTYNFTLKDEFCLTSEGLYSHVAKAAEKGHLEPGYEAEILAGLLTGSLEVIKLPWKPENGDNYWYLELDGTASVCKTIWNNSTFDLALYKLGKLYRTCEEAEAHVAEDEAFWDQIRKEIEVQ